MDTCNKLVEKWGGWEPRDLVMNKAIVANYMHTISRNNSAGQAYPVNEGLEQIDLPEIPQYIFDSDGGEFDEGRRQFKLSTNG